MPYLAYSAIRCISFDSYIKPQPFSASRFSCSCCISFDSYIKPQRNLNVAIENKSCISFDSYIKPQPHTDKWVDQQVVSLLIPTSNHNQ